MGSVLMGSVLMGSDLAFCIEQVCFDSNTEDAKYKV